jgi:hypothetical protein
MTVKDWQRLQSAEINFYEGLKDLPQKTVFRNASIGEHPERRDVQGRIQDYSNKLRQHLERMEEIRLPKAGRKDLGRPRKR